MIPAKFVDLYARNSGLRDKLVAERDIVLTYALRLLVDTGAMRHLAFKGGTCLRKTLFGSNGRFSEDLDFTLCSELPVDDALVAVVEALNGTSHGISFTLQDYYKTDEGTSFGGDVTYRHEWNDAGRFRLQVSLRERPTLPVAERPLKHQAYFPQLEFEPFTVRSLEAVEIIGEKVRAAYQRVKVRDAYDLHRFAALPFDGELVRRLAVLKLWQVRDPFDPEALFQRLRSSVYDWEDLRRLLRTGEPLAEEQLLRGIERRFAFLRTLTELEQKLVADAKSGWNEPLAEQLRDELRTLFTRAAGTKFDFPGA